MIILTLRTDKPESEIGLYQDEKVIAYENWEAHRKLAETLHNKIKTLLNSRSLELKDIDGVVFFLGPGSFTGLRIGASVANSLSYSLDVPISGTQGEDWLAKGIIDLRENASTLPLVPEYGASVHTTNPRR